MQLSQLPQTPIPVTLDQVRRFRLIRSGLLQPFADPETASANLMGIQAQILPAAGVALWNRTARADPRTVRTAPL